MAALDLCTKADGKGSVALKRISIPPGVDRESMIATSRELAALRCV